MTILKKKIVILLTDKQSVNCFQIFAATSENNEQREPEITNKIFTHSMLQPEIGGHGHPCPRPCPRTSYTFFCFQTQMMFPRMFQMYVSNLEFISTVFIEDQGWKARIEGQGKSGTRT